MDYERLISSFLDEKYAVLDFKKELAAKLNLRVEDIKKIDLVHDEFGVSECICVIFKKDTILTPLLKTIKFEYLSVDTCGRLVLVLADDLDES